MGSSLAALRRPRTGRYLAAASLGVLALVLAAPAAAQNAQAPQIPPPAPAPVVAVVAEAPPPPTAPPVPFRFVGLLEEKASKPAAFIAKGDALYVVRVGDVVENTYRVESFNSAQVVVTYLPLQQRQTIEVTGG